MMSVRTAITLAVVGMIGLSTQVSACSVCFGNPDSNLTKGFGWGIISLLGVVVLVLGSIVSFFIYLAKRSAMASGASAAESRPEITNKV